MTESQKQYPEFAAAAKAEFVRGLKTDPLGTTAKTPARFRHEDILDALYELNDRILNLIDFTDRAAVGEELAEKRDVLQGNHASQLTVTQFMAEAPVYIANMSEKMAQLQQKLHDMIYYT